MPRLLLFFVKALDLTLLPVACAFVEPQKRLFQFRDSNSVLTALEFGVLIKLNALASGINDRLNKRTVRLFAIRTTTERAVLPIDT
jgi:hypothetical protein